MMTGCARVSKVAVSCERKLFSSQRTIVYDCNVPTVAFELIEHNGYSVDFIKAVAVLKTDAPLSFNQ